MDLNGHTFIDILKIDIEGGEFDALTAFLSSTRRRRGRRAPRRPAAARDPRARRSREL
ncbi:hypothetical protein EDB84DRAFT_1525867 [Lactarius hengduanensis]|nr:hypothetical protein EDB84DRAFT_1525867 [Lactarius hengduanensis]